MGSNMGQSPISSKRMFLVLKVLSAIPPSRLFRFKTRLLKWAGVDICASARVMSDIFVATGGTLSIGDDTFIGHGVSILGGGADIIIGDSCDISSKVTIISGTHEIGGESQRAAGKSYSQPIFIHDRVWVGAAVTILGNVTIGKGAIIAAGAVVNRDVAAGDRVGGVPARSLSK